MAGLLRLFAAAALGAAGAMSCSSGSGDEIAEPAPAESSTSTTIPSTTTTTEATTTTLSEQAEAESDVAQVAEAFWTAPIDTSQGMYGLEYTTGLLKARLEGVIERNQADGQVTFNEAGVNPFEVITVDVDLEEGQAEVKACKASYSALLDSETGAEIFASDPEFLATIVFYLQETSEGWKIYEFIGTAEDAEPERCEIES